jgi:hypothetical protein
MKRILSSVRQRSASVLALSAAVILCGVAGLYSPPADAAGGKGDRGPFPTGLWYAASDAGIPQIFAFVSAHADGTFTYSSVVETGGSAFFAGEFTPAQGLWSREGNQVVFRAFSIQRTEWAGSNVYGILRFIFVMDVESRNELFGVADFDFLPCNGEQDCPNPDDDPLVVGEGDTGGVPVYLRRVSRRDF